MRYLAWVVRPAIAWVLRGRFVVSARFVAQTEWVVAWERMQIPCSDPSREHREWRGVVHHGERSNDDQRSSRRSGEDRGVPGQSPGRHQWRYRDGDGGHRRPP